MPRDMLLPAVTYCNINGIALFQLCIKGCHVIASKKYSKRYPPGADVLKNINGLMIPYSNVSQLFTVPQDEILKYSNINLEGNLVKDYRAHLRNVDDNIVETHRFKVAPAVRSALKNPPICSSFNVMENPANESLIYVPASYTMTTHRRMHSHTYLFGPQYGAYQISVHSPFNYNNPFVDGYETREGMSYYLDVSLVIKKTLPKPYETDCFDYLKKLKEEERPGPTNQKECIEECKMQLSLSENNCVLWSIWYPHSLKRCEPANERELLVSYIKKCVPRCKPACLEYILVTKKNEFAPRDSHNCETGMDMAQNIFPPVSYYVLRFHPAIETIYETRPKYEFIEAISNIGGFVGMWMGISLIAVYNMLEETIAFAWQSFRLNRKKKTRIVRLI